MKVKGLLSATVALVAAMVAFAFWAASDLPPGTELPTHWNAAGEVDGTRPALQALLFTPAVTLVLGLVMAALPSLEPMQRKLEASAPVMRVAWLGLLGVMSYMQLMIAAPLFGWPLDISLINLVLGAMFVALGNVLPKSRPNFFVGIRTPWTITDTDNWIATHRLGGKLLMLAGLVIAVSALVPLGATTRLTVLLIALLGAALVPIGYSYWLWRQAELRR